MIWDISKIGEEETAMVFDHSGHMAKISDIAWNSNE
jgi:hypothetical protein